jgi:acyl carrier protein
MNAPRVADIYTLTPAQEGMLLRALAEPSSAVYHEQLWCGIEGELDVDVLQRAWQLVIDRHDALRTAFHVENLSKPVQVVQAQAELAWHVQDGRAATDEERDGQAAAFRRAVDEWPLPPSDAPLMRCALLRTGEKAYELAWKHHHLALDGWSVLLVLREVFGAYDALVRGEEPRFAPAPPFKRHIAWLLSRDLSTAEAYWRDALEGFSGPITIGGRPAGAPQPADGPEPWGDRDVWLSEEETAELTGLATSVGVTLGTVIQGAWALVLGRYSGTHDVVYGVTLAGRPAEQRGADSTVGLFTNTLPMRVAVDGAAPLARWLRDLQERQAAMAAHQWTPMSLVHAWSGLHPGQAFFESLVVVENHVAFFDPRQLSATLDVGRLQSRGARTTFPVVVLAVPGKRLLLRIVHERARLDDVDVERLESVVREVLRGMTGHPGPTVGDLAVPAVPPEEQWPALEVGAARPVRVRARYLAPNTPIEKRLAEIWSEVLQIEDVGLDDSFFELGGYSLAAIQALSRVREAFQIELPLAALFTHGSTLRGLTEMVEAALIEQASESDLRAEQAAVDALSDEQVAATLAGLATQTDRGAAS